MRFRLRQPRMQDATLIDDRFQVFAVKVDEHTIYGRRGLKEELYYFYRGYQIIDNGNVIKCERGLSNCDQVFNDYLVEQSLKTLKTKTVPHISISAIVGKNGSGKSTIVEFVLRLINNFSAMMFGEQLTGEGLEHLHYIDGVGGELYWSMDERIYRLTVIGRQIELDCYEIDEDNEENQDVYKIIPSRKLMVSQDDVEPILDAYGEVEQMMPYLELFFYTVVSNYAISLDKGGF